MMQLINKTIIDKLPDLINGAGESLELLKYSTPTSGKSLNDKVIFFVFKPREKVPFLCVKTVRSYDAREIIIRNFDNLKKINTLTASSPYFDLFAQALYLHDDGENIFSIETICPGKRIKLNKKKLSFVVAEYIGFQEYLAKNSSESVSDIKDFVKEIISKSKLKELDQQKLLQFTETLPLDNVKLPRLIQHGDVTEDNILLSKKRLCIIDYDFVGVTDLPGFDLFGLFSRFNQSEVKELCYKYFPKYFSRIDVDVESNKYKGLLFLYFLIERILRKPHPLENESAEKIISDFKDMTI
jgi:serine/threonine protein kinase